MLCVYSCAAGCGSGAERNRATHKPRKSGVCEACLFCGAGPRRAGTEARRWEELGKALVLGCLFGLFIPHLRAGVNHSAPPFLR